MGGSFVTSRSSCIEDVLISSEVSKVGARRAPPLVHAVGRPSRRCDRHDDGDVRAGKAVAVENCAGVVETGEPIGLDSRMHRAERCRVGLDGRTFAHGLDHGRRTAGGEESNVLSRQVTGRKALPSSHGVVENGVMTPNDVPPTAAMSHRMRAGAPVVVGADGSAESERGMMFAADLVDHARCRTRGGPCPRDVQPPAGWQTPVEEHEREAETLLRTRSGALRSPTSMGSDGVCRSPRGPQPRRSCEWPTTVDAGFIVLGSHGAGHSDQPLLGSTSHWIVRNSHRPVIIVPPDDNHPHRRPGCRHLIRRSPTDECPRLSRTAPGAASGLSRPERGVARADEGVR